MSTRIIYEGKIVTLTLEEAKLPNGLVHTQEIVRHPGGACVVPVFENGDVLLLRQYRVAAGGYIWEIPAGKLDVAGENPEGCAERELIEEAGYKAAKLQKIAEFFTSPGFCNETLHVYKATGLMRASTSFEKHEVIEIHRLSTADVSKMMREGEIRDAKTLIGLYACGFGMKNL